MSGDSDDDEGEVVEVLEDEGEQEEEEVSNNVDDAGDDNGDEDSAVVDERDDNDDDDDEGEIDEEQVGEEVEEDIADEAGRQRYQFSSYVYDRHSNDAAAVAILSGNNNNNLNIHPHISRPSSSELDMRSASDARLIMSRLLPAAPRLQPQPHPVSRYHLHSSARHHQNHQPPPSHILRQYLMSALPYVEQLQLRHQYHQHHHHHEYALPQEQEHERERAYADADDAEAAIAQAANEVVLSAQLDIDNMSYDDLLQVQRWIRLRNACIWFEFFIV